MYKEIIKLLDANHVEYNIIDHEPVYTSEQAAKIRGLSIDEGAKSLLLKSEKCFSLAVLSGSKKLDSKEYKLHIKAKDLRFATPDEVKTVMKCEIGACYPFGNLIGLETIVDAGLLENEFISFNPGQHDKSIRVKSSDYSRIVNPSISHISKGES